MEKAHAPILGRRTNRIDQLSLIRLLLIVMAAALAVTALKLAILALIVAGLIFRTKETIGLVVFFGTLGAVSQYPMQCLGIATIAILISLYCKSAGRSVAPAALEAPSQD